MTTDVDVPSIDDEFSQLTAYAGNFPSSDDLGSAAELFEHLAAWDGHEGPRARLQIAAGAIAIAKKDLARRERSAEKAERRRQKMIDQRVAYEQATGQWPTEPESQREITEWSRKSRGNMVRALCEIDFTRMMSRPGRPPAMVTLTYPGDWLTVAPNGKASKEHLREFARRWRRAWGEDLEAVWKLEFQRRGAPHYHLLVIPPHGTALGRRNVAGARRAFRVWLSQTWAAIVDHPDLAEYAKHVKAGTGVDFAEGMRARDPKRVAVYFTKHGSFRAKEYQHVVPDAWQSPGDGPGRFWGYLRLARVVYGVELSPHVAIQVARLARRWSHAQRVTREHRVPRVLGGRPVAASWDVIGLAGAQLLAGQAKGRHRTVRRRVARLRTGAGWISVNSGAVFATQVARYLYQLRDGAQAAAWMLAGPRTGDA